MNEKMNIPKTIHVGYQTRKDTYTGKLAYVIYTDEKGKKRKQSSWDSWRDSKIDPSDFENVPTTGFVLNKGVGGSRASWGWNPRNEYIRVFDPRGFEFEISVANLLFILAECTSTKGKGLEGEFVYAWSGTELVLLPVDSYEYKTSTEFTSMKTMKVDKKDFIEGHLYQHKDTSELVYMGRYNARREVSSSSWNLREFINTIKTAANIKYHIFYSVKHKRWLFERGFTNIARKLSNDVYPEFANLVTELTTSKYLDSFDELVLQPVSVDESDLFYNKVLMAGDNGEYYIIRLSRQQSQATRYHYTESKMTALTCDELLNQFDKANIYGCATKSINDVDIKRIFKLKCKLKSGKVIGVPGYV